MNDYTLSSRNHVVTMCATLTFLFTLYTHWFFLYTFFHCPLAHPRFSNSQCHSNFNVNAQIAYSIMRLWINNQQLESTTRMCVLENFAGRKFYSHSYWSLPVLHVVFTLGGLLFPNSALIPPRRNNRKNISF